MKLLMLAALAAVATPALALAQTTPPAAPDPAMAPAAPAAPAAPDAAMSPRAPPAAPDAMPAAPADGTYPMCSRTVTDHCKERSNAAGARMHSTPRPR